MLLVAQSIEAWRSTRRLARPARAAHLPAPRNCLLDPMGRIGLDIQVGVGRRHNTIAFLLRAGVNPHCYWLGDAIGWLHIQPHAEHSPFPERGGFPRLHPLA